MGVPAWRALVALAAMMLALGCSTAGLAAVDGARIEVGDIDALTGGAWTGTLTYLDYTSHARTTIDSSLMVRRVAGASAAWEFGTGYSKEPHADSMEVISLAEDGSKLGEQRVVSRTALPGGGIRIVTASEGTDDERPAAFRFEYSISAHEFVRRKMVRFAGEPDYFERHVYRWTRE